MFPRLFSVPPFSLFGHSIGPLTLHSYGVLLAVAFVVGLWVASRQAQRAGLDPVKVTDLAVYLLIAGLVGAKLMMVIVEWRTFTSSTHELWSLLQSGGVFYGGLLAALPVALWYVRRHGLPGWKTADVLTPALAIGHAIGRLGCFCAGCCYGRPTDVAWAVKFTDVYAYRNVGTPLDTALHPTQLYESAALAVIFLALLAIARRKRFDGQVTTSYIIMYAVARFVIEFFRGDPGRGEVLGLSTSQVVAVALVIGVLIVLPRLLKKPASQPPAPPASA